MTMARACRLALCVAAGVWLVLVARLSRDVEVEPPRPDPSISSPLRPASVPFDRGPVTTWGVPVVRPASALDEGTAGREMQRLRDHWQRAVLLR
ncbi:MAG TPA: hypothetical protein VN716_10120 [Vicinamibacterales bacterium]|nr:hypothetical protein [Vicinamibacterales bacterium]